MAFDGLVLHTIVKELQHHIIGGKIDKIFEPNTNEIILGVYCNGVKYALNIVTSSQYYRMCLTTSPKPNPTYAPNFCMVLRKYLLNTRITKIEMSSLERIVTIEFEGHSKADDNESKKLIIELMGKHSNIILTNANHVIIDALKHFHITENSYRNIIPNVLYTLPITNKLDFMQTENSEIFYQNLLDYVHHSGQPYNPSDDSDSLLLVSPISSTLQSDTSELKLSNMISDAYTGICKTSVKSILQDFDIEDVFDKTHVVQVYDYLNDIIKSSHCDIKSFYNDYAVCLNNTSYSVDDKTYLDDTHTQETLQANFFIDDYYTQKEDSQNFKTYRDNLSKLLLNYLKKLNSKLSNIHVKLKECENTDLYKLYGELITNNLYRISNNHLSEISIENYYNDNQLITIPLDKTVSPQINAKRYFKKYNKLKNARQIVESQKSEVEAEIDYLESIIYEFELATTISDIDHIYQEFSDNFSDKNIYRNNQKQRNKKQKISKKSNQNVLKIGTPIECDIDGFKVIIGKNNRQNDYITKQAKDDDIWFHTKDIHGSHVILKTENKLPTQETINKVASLAAFYSKASESNNVSVDYTFAKYVKKPSKAKPGMVVYTNQKNVIVKPQIAIHTKNI